LGISDPESHFRRLIYGLGVSHNEDRYIDEYKSFVNDHSNGSGKLINLSKATIGSFFSNNLSELTSNGSTTISASSSLNSLSSYNSQNP
jgi:hypothetical protein